MKTKKITARTREELMREELPEARRFTEKQARRAFAEIARRGIIVNQSPEGPPYEKVALVKHDHPLAPILDLVKKGPKAFSRTEVENRLNAKMTEHKAAKVLGRAGLAIIKLDEKAVYLRAVDVRAAELVNKARLHNGRRGVKINKVIEAILPVRNPNRSQAYATENRRLQAAELLEREFDILADDLLDTSKKHVRLFSRWHIDDYTPSD